MDLVLVQDVSPVAIFSKKLNFCKPEICPILLKLWSTIKSDQCQTVSSQKLNLTILEPDTSKLQET